MSEKRKPIPKHIRQKVYEKYDGHCAYCGCKLEYKDMQVDHINPFTGIMARMRLKIITQPAGCVIFINPPTR